MGRMRSTGTRAWILFIALVLALAVLAPAQRGPARSEDEAEDSNEPVVDLGPGITPPRVTHQVSPDFDSSARGFRIAGVVLIGLIVSSHGVPREVHVVRSLDKELDQSAVAAVQQWRFEPARKAATPVAVRVTVEIRFQDL
jgi:TonB family protein